MRLVAMLTGSPPMNVRHDVTKPNNVATDCAATEQIFKCYEIAK